MFAVPSRIRYGLRALVFLELNSENKPVSIGLISEKENISRKYLENIFKLLMRSGIIRSTRGPAGGYKLAVSADEITVFSMIEALEGPIIPINCIDDPAFCGKTDSCGTKDLWMDYQDHINKYLRSMTLSHIIMKYYRGSFKTPILKEP